MTERLLQILQVVDAELEAVDLLLQLIIFTSSLTKLVLEHLRVPIRLKQFVLPFHASSLLLIEPVFEPRFLET